MFKKFEKVVRGGKNGVKWGKNGVKRLTQNPHIYTTKLLVISSADAFNLSKSKNLV